MPSTIPTRTLAGVTVPDTPLVTAAVAFAKEHLSAMAFNHVMRSFLFGFCIASRDPNFSDRDIEVHAISAILHDQGWAGQKAPFITKTKRFEVDGADAAREFLRREAPDWDKHRLQLVWDAIALHTTPGICMYKEVEVVVCHKGIAADFQGPDHSEGKLTWEEFDAIIKEFPRLKFADGVTEILCGFCRDKPETTYDNFMASYGERYVEGYSREGKMLIDRMPYTREVLDSRSA